MTAWRTRFRTPDPTLSWVRGGVRYELLNPKMLGAVMLAPWFVAVLARSLADLPWPQQVLLAQQRFGVGDAPAVLTPDAAAGPMVYVGKRG